MNANEVKKIKHIKKFVLMLLITLIFTYIPSNFYAQIITENNEQQLTDDEIIATICTYSYDQLSLTLKLMLTEYKDQMNPDGIEIMLVDKTYYTLCTKDNFIQNCRDFLNSYEEPDNKKEFTIKYNLDGGINDARNPDKYTEGSTIILYDPVKNGYKFLGWYEDPEFVYKFIQITFNTAQDLDLYAKWEEDVYSIKYVLNKGKFSKKQKKNLIRSYRISSDSVQLAIPKRKGYKFCGWYTSKEFDENTQIEKIDTGSYGDIKIYAKWKKK